MTSDVSGAGFAKTFLSPVSILPTANWPVGDWLAFCTSWLAGRCVYCSFSWSVDRWQEERTKIQSQEHLAAIFKKASFAGDPCKSRVPKKALGIGQVLQAARASSTAKALIIVEEMLASLAYTRGTFGSARIARQQATFNPADPVFAFISVL